MATVIRLSRAGRKKRPFYHVVVADSRKARNSRFIEQLGYFDPMAEGKGLWQINHDRLNHWLNTGAQPSKRVMGYAIANSLGSENQRKRWQDGIERRKQVNLKYKQQAQAEKDAETAAGTEA